MQQKAFLVWHDGDAIEKEADRREEAERNLKAATDAATVETLENYLGDLDAKPTTRRYLVWGESHSDAARSVQEQKKLQGRILPDRYFVAQLRTFPKDGNHMTELGADGDGDADEWDVTVFEGLFGEPWEVRL